MIDRRWSILGVLFLARAAMGFQFESIASTAPSLITALHVDYATIGTLIGLYMLPGIFIAFPGGLLSSRFGDKTVCAAGLVLMIAGGILLGLSHAVVMAFVGRIASGIGAVLFTLVVTKMATDWFAGREIVLAMGVLLASWPFGIGVGLVTQPLLADSRGWPWVMFLTAALCGAALLLIFAAYREPPYLVSASPAAGPLLPPLREMLPTAVAGVIWGNLNLALVLFFSFGPATLAAHGVPIIAATIWTGVGLWIVMLSVPFGGAFVQRSGRPEAAIVVFAALGAVVLALLSVGILPRLLSAAFGVVIGPQAGAIMALPSRVLSPRHRAGGLGLFYMAYYALMSFGPMVAGLLREVLGTPTVVTLLASALLAAAAPLLWLFRRLAWRADPAGV